MVLDSVERGVTFQRLQRDVEDELNELGRLVLQWAIEGADERLCENADERKDWVIARRGDVKRDPDVIWDDVVSSDVLSA